MSMTHQPIDLHRDANVAIDHAIGLLSQQVWCWGRDILRPEGNWLLEVGFERIEPPLEREDSSSVYVLHLSRGRCVVLRAFGVFYGDRDLGGIFLPRFKFRPGYTKLSSLDSPPWSDEDLPDFFAPNEQQRNHCAMLTLDLIDWIRGYEANIAEHLGIEYRRLTLMKWKNAERLFTPAEELASAWRELSFRVAANFDVYCRPYEPPEVTGDQGNG